MCLLLSCRVCKKSQRFNVLYLVEAAEYRQILAYSGTVLFKKYLPSERYECIKTLAVAFCILNSDKIYNNKSLVVYAETLLDYFIQQLDCTLWSGGYNNVMHSFWHLPRDCKRFGLIISFSCITFKNFNFELSDNIPSGNNPSLY